MNEIKIDIPIGMRIDMQNSNFNQGIISFTPDINWTIVCNNAKKIEVNSAFPERTKIINRIMHLAAYLNSIATCNSDESWIICKGKKGNYTTRICTGALISFKTMYLAEIAINVIGKQALDTLINEQYLFRE